MTQPNFDSGNQKSEINKFLKSLYTAFTIRFSDPLINKILELIITITLTKDDAAVISKDDARYTAVKGFLDRIKLLLTILVIAILLACMVRAGFFMLNTLLPWIISNVSPWVAHPEKANQNWPFKAFICGTVLVSGSTLFWVRSRHPKLYGLGEIAFSLVTAYATLTKFGRDENLLVWLGLFASAYLVVRGLDNCTKESVRSK
jgi:hypothetical protein